MSHKCFEYTYDEIEIGLKKEFSVEITESLVNEFARISGDHSPIHMNNEYASTTSFKKRVVHGMLLASFFSRIDGMYLPGKHALYFSQSLQFLNPCFIDDIVTVKSEVTDKSDATKIITLKSQIYNGDGKILVKGIGEVLVRND
jgi:acyl dehydratase